MTLSKIGLFYGSSTCYTEFVAEKIAEKLGKDMIDVHNIATTPIEMMQDYTLLIFGIPTWDYGELQEDWDAIWDDMENLDLTGHTVAIFGLGDQIGYPTWFQDALGYLYHKLNTMGVIVTGLWPNEGYEFSDSKGLTADRTHFLGLALDEENQPKLTEHRLNTWLLQVKESFEAAEENYRTREMAGKQV